MYGNHIGSLNVYTRTSVSGAMSKVWSKSGNLGDKWVKAVVPISVSQNFQVGLTFHSNEGGKKRGGGVEKKGGLNKKGQEGRG